MGVCRDADSDDPCTDGLEVCLNPLADGASGDLGKSTDGGRKISSQRAELDAAGASH